MASILKKQEIELLLHTRDILDEILESIEVARDPAMVRAIKEGLRDIKAGRVRPYKEFVRELRNA